MQVAALVSTSAVTRRVAVLRTARRFVHVLVKVRAIVVVVAVRSNHHFVFIKKPQD
jgi:hypothetical protein